ncbi:hypothetical protein BDA99DRAFT_559356 [Phascolomyces articulosus]|uniref:Uncharacterized protein n=1 Tax=Phascolomyces articulosus TaxID=60185 RepID=A0AAD5KE70_9FUNG|nr:hypothetical protein BDA99DRAFT_559356 [Phascolomyces articulosus]
MSEQNNIDVLVERYQSLSQKAGTLSAEEQQELVACSSRIKSSLYSGLQQPQQQQQQNVTASPAVQNQEEKRKLAAKLVEDAMKKRQETTLAIANQCGLSIFEVEVMFGGKNIKLYSSTRANDYNHANGLCGAVNTMSIDNKCMMAQEMVEVIRKILQKIKDLIGLEWFVLFGSHEFHVGLDFIDEMNKESNQRSNFYALQEKFEFFL